MHLRACEECTAVTGLTETHIVSHIKTHTHTDMRIDLVAWRLTRNGGSCMLFAVVNADSCALRRTKELSSEETYMMWYHLHAPARFLHHHVHALQGL